MHHRVVHPGLRIAVAGSVPTDLLDIEDTAVVVAVAVVAEGRVAVGAGTMDIAPAFEVGSKAEAVVDTTLAADNTAVVDMFAAAANTVELDFAAAAVPVAQAVVLAETWQQVSAQQESIQPPSQRANEIVRLLLALVTAPNQLLASVSALDNVMC